jgi:hypothetical protein
MRGTRIAAFGLGLLTALPASAAEPPELWQAERAAGAEETTYRLDLARLKSLLARAPLEGTDAAVTSSVEITLPLDGRLVRFAAVESPVLEPKLAALHPDIRTYEGKESTIRRRSRAST